ncbi:MAG: hypothetical protein Q8891_01330 [Bacteroidota bacterium]|nr:hypothetical protein [Bacteroidota bacterium]
MKLINILSYLGIVLLAILTGSCDKTKPYKVITPSPAVHFVGDATQAYSLDTSTVGPYTIMIGTTDVSSKDRLVTYNVTSQTGAVEGSQYTLTPAGTVTIPAGQSLASISVQGNYSFYTSGRKDTLTFSLSEPSVKVASFLDTVQLVLRGPCFDGDVTLSDMSGDYAHTTDPDDAPYTVTISNLTSTSATTGTGTINNLWDVGGNVTINFDWTDPANVQVSVPRQNLGIDYAAGQPISVRTTPGTISNFSVCNQTITLATDLIVENYFGPGQGALYATNYVFKIKR